MRKWINKKLDGDKLWLSYWPSSFTLLINLFSIFGNLYFPAKSNLLNDFLILCGSFGVAFSLKGINMIYKYRKDLNKRRS